MVFLLMPVILYFTYSHLAPVALTVSSGLIDNYRLAGSAFLSSSKTERKYEDEEEVEEFKQGLAACKLFLFFAIYNVADGGLYPLFTSLAGLNDDE